MVKLTSREHELVQALCEGLSNRRIASRFGMSEQSVKNRLTVVFHKFGVNSRLKLALAVAQQSDRCPATTAGSGIGLVPHDVDQWGETGLNGGPVEPTHVSDSPIG